VRNRRHHHSSQGCGVALCSKLTEQVGFWEMQVIGGLSTEVSRGLRVLCWVLKALMFGWVEFCGRMVGEGDTGLQMGE